MLYFNYLTSRLFSNITIQSGPPMAPLLGPGGGSESRGGIGEEYEEGEGGRGEEYEEGGRYGEGWYRDGGRGGF